MADDISIRYNTVFHEMRIKYDLTLVEFCIMDSIDILSHNRKYNGWCVLSKQSIADFIGCSKRKVQTSINKLCSLGLCERSKDGSDVRSTDKFIRDKHYYKDMAQKKSDDSGDAIPSMEEVKKYFKDNGYSVDVAEKMYNYYNASVEGTNKKFWTDVNGKKVRSWKQKARSVWFKEENKAKEGNKPTFGTF